MLPTSRSTKSVENIQVVAEKLGVTIFYFYAEKTPDSAVAEHRPTYKPAPEESQLLKYFRKIKDNISRNTVLRVARLAARTHK